MIDVTVGTRLVVILGRRRLGVDADHCIGRAGELGASCLVLSVGYPATERQQRFVDEAVRRAFDRLVHLEAELVFDISGLRSRVELTDEVVIAAAGREERRIGSVLQPQGS